VERSEIERGHPKGWGVKIPLFDRKIANRSPEELQKYPRVFEINPGRRQSEGFEFD
jgi:hypothetical protein